MSQEVGNEVYMGPLYAHSTPPVGVTTSIAQLEGPYFILIAMLCILGGANASLYALYLQRYSGRNGDRWWLQLAVAVAVACNLAMMLMTSITYFHTDYITMYTKRGFDMNALEWYVVPCHILQGIPDAIGQFYFLLRIARLFDRSRHTTIPIYAMGFAILLQLALSCWFGAAFFSMKTKTKIAADPKARNLVKGIISTWVALFITIETLMTATTIGRLWVMRQKSNMDAAKKVIFRLAVYSVQGQLALTTFSFTSVYLFSKSKTGWYSPYYLCSGSFYTVVLLANLLYRSEVAKAMQEVMRSTSAASGSGSRGFQQQSYLSHSHSLSHGNNNNLQTATNRGTFGTLASSPQQDELRLTPLGEAANPRPQQHHRQHSLPLQHINRDLQSPTSQMTDYVTGQASVTFSNPYSVNPNLTHRKNSLSMAAPSSVTINIEKIEGDTSNNTITYNDETAKTKW